MCSLPPFGHRRDVGVGLEDLDVGIGLDVARLDLASLVDAQIERLGGVDVRLERHLLEVEDDVGRVLDHTGNRRELVQHAVDLDGGNGRALDRGQQHAPHGVADGGAEAPFERLSVKTAKSIGQRFTFELETLRPLKTFPEHGVTFLSIRGSNREHPPDLPFRSPPPTAGPGRLRAESYILLR